MTATPPSLANLKSNPAWASLPLFDRTGWKRMAFGDFAESIGERAEPKDAQEEIYVGLEHLDPQCLHIRRWGKGSDVIGGKLRFRKGDIIFGKRRAYQRKLAVAEFGGICSAHAMVIRARPDKVLPEFLPFLMMSDRFMNRAVEISVGSLSPTINWTTLKLETFDLPPLDQQRRIAEILWALDEALEASRANLAAVDVLRIAKLFDRYRRGIGHSKFTNTALGERPVSWEVAPLGHHYQVQLGKMMSPKAISGGSQRPYLRNANVQWNRLDLSDVATMSFDEREAQKFELRDGDILACEGRHVGKSAIWRNEIPGACFQKALHRIRALDHEQVPEFMLFQMEHHSRSGIFADQVGETTIPHLPAERLRAIPFSFPPKQEQRAIADEIENLGAAATKLQVQVDASSKLLGALVEVVVSDTPATT
jgi:restriction endonuclease S subunit